jgi:hypothetical protein
MERYRIHADVAVYYLTYAIVDWLPVFVAESSCKIITDSRRTAILRRTFGSTHLSSLPTHMHLIVLDAQSRGAGSSVEKRPPRLTIENIENMEQPTRQRRKPKENN